MKSNTIYSGFRAGFMLLLLGSFMVGCGGGGGGGSSSGTSDTTPPTVSSTNPTNNATGVAVNTAIAATFNETMNASSITAATFTVNGVTGTVTYNGTTATFTPTSNLAYNTTYTATITTGAKDSSGNSMAAAHTWSFTTGATTDSTPPTVSSTNPTNNATGVTANAAITATFSETMNAATVTTATFTLDNGVTGTVTYNGTTATFTPSSNLAYSTTYTAMITTGAKDVAGNALAANYAWTFTTTGAPAVTPGSLDTAFNTTGKVTTDFANNEVAFAVAIQSDGKILAAGYSVGPYDFLLVRYNTNGSLDTSFGTGGKVLTDIGGSDDAALAVAIQSDGKIVAAGYAANGSTHDFALVRYNADGSLDTAFGTGGKVVTSMGTSFGARAVAIQANGKIVAAGYSGYGAKDFALVRYNANGSLDTTFNTTGKVITSIGAGDDIAYAVAIQADGKIVAAGSSNNVTNGDFALIRYNSDGSLDTSFNTTGKVTTDIGVSNDGALAVAIQADGRIVAAGNSDNNFFALIRYAADGSLDTTFGTGGKVTTAIGTWDIASAIAIQSDGKIVAAGYSSNDFALVRYAANGSLDTTFGTGGKVTTAIGAGYDGAYAVAIQADGKIVAAGYSSNGANDDFALARYWP